MTLSRMNFWILAEGAALASTLLMNSIPSLAAQPRKAAVRQEVYSATESEGGSVVVSAPVAVMPAQAVAAPRQAAGIARPAATAPRVAAPAAPMPAPAVLAKPALANALPDSALAYDPVPSDQIDALGKRLQLVDAIIRRHGRAYDYRTHTVRELELVLARLDASVAPKTAALKASAAPQTAPIALPTPTEEDELDGGSENPHNTDF